MVFGVLSLLLLYSGTGSVKKRGSYLELLMRKGANQLGGLRRGKELVSRRRRVIWYDMVLFIWLPPPPHSLGILIPPPYRNGKIVSSLAAPFVLFFLYEILVSRCFCGNVHIHLFVSLPPSLPLIPQISPPLKRKSRLTRPFPISSDTFKPPPPFLSSYLFSLQKTIEK